MLFRPFVSFVLTRFVTPVTPVILLAYTSSPSHHRKPFYEDFPSTMERLRLCLVNARLLTAAERCKFSLVVAQGEQLCIRIFVRHAVRRGAYELFSLGVAASPDFPRKEQCEGGPGRWCVSDEQVAVVMGEARRQLDGCVGGGGGADEYGYRGRKGGERCEAYSRGSGYGKSASDASTAQIGGSMHAASSQLGSEAYVGSSTAAALHAPMSWAQRDLGSVNGYVRPYRTYPTYHAYGSGIPAPVQMDMVYDPQQVSPYTPHQHVASQSYGRWSYGMYEGYTVPYTFPVTTSLPPVANGMSGIQPLAAGVVDHQTRYSSVPERSYAAVVSGQGRDDGPETGALACGPRPDAQEFVP